MNDGKREDTLRYQLIGLIPRLRRFARGLTKDFGQADDLVQEACERALKNRAKYGKELRLESLLYRIVYKRMFPNNSSTLSFPNRKRKTGNPPYLVRYSDWQHPSS